ncbi:MAG: hypothetical protein R3214_09215, partial [Christiangramia sp.]|nr:hypothetical protein [Christiangramia sp.]
MNKYLILFALTILCINIKAQNPADKYATIYFKDGAEKSVIINFDKTIDFSQATYRASAESKPEIAAASKIDSIISKDDKNNFFSRKIGKET